MSPHAHAPRPNLLSTSKTAELLLSKVAKGVLYPNTLQEIAAANLADGLEAMDGMAKLGNYGKFPGNAERDLMQLVRKLYGLRVRA